MQQHHIVAALQQPATTFAGADHSWCLNLAWRKSTHVRSAFYQYASNTEYFCFCACSSEDTVVPARGRKLVKTGIAIHTPPGTYGRVAPRSGLAVNHFIDVGAGVIDEDYRGEVRVLLFNHEDKDFTGAGYPAAVAPLRLHLYRPPHCRNFLSASQRSRCCSLHAATKVQVLHADALPAVLGPDDSHTNALLLPLRLLLLLPLLDLPRPFPVSS
jgi:hypothetical protein